LRRELDDYKRRFTEQLTDLTSLRKDRDEAKSDLTDMNVENGKDIEMERAKRREVEGEFDRLKFKLSSKEDEMQREVKRNEEIGVKLTKLHEDLKTSDLILREKDSLVQTLQR